ncbi:DUF4178 domain-containing protein [uncultured Dokdonia sp.]|uniref:DUF4178 domain-containing protein n=1 Tax=uncultured Dokdonia sp. TaxID=575653 RepID=UPI00260EA35D|nr:DUF4178 domain-containing protein [uncultured Dokdonia sp.]
MFGNNNDVQLTNLRVGTTFKYKSNAWEIIEVSDYDWGVDGKSTEYKIRSKNNSEAFLEVERHQGDYEIYFSEQITLPEETLKDSIATKFIIYDGQEYEQEEHYRGSFKNQTLGGSWERIEVFMFYASDDSIITIEKSQDETLTVYAGVEIKEKALKSIKSN